MFVIDGKEFHTVEHYLAYEKAKLSGVEANVDRALRATDPKEAKAILHQLKDDHPDDWNSNIAAIAIKGLRAKFSQNDHLLDFLRKTGHLQLGEASKNERWGIGLHLNDPDVLDGTKWNPAGNLLGKCLMEVRHELCPELCSVQAADNPT